MSTIGKIFIILNVLLAAAFLGAASTVLGAHESWKERHDTLDTSTKSQIDELEQVRSTLTVQLEGHKAEGANLRNQNLNLENEKRALQERFDGLQERFDSLTGSVEGLKSTLADLQGTVDSQQQLLQQANTQAQEAISARHAAENEREQAVSAMNAAQAQLHQAQNDIAELERQRTGLERARQTLETELATLVDVTGTSLTEIQAQPYIKGAVLQVVRDLEPGIVSINKGSADNVKRGFTFEIWNGTTYKGQVRVTNVRENMCTAIITRPVPGTTISQGDVAATQI